MERLAANLENEVLEQLDEIWDEVEDRLDEGLSSIEEGNFWRRLGEAFELALLALLGAIIWEGVRVGEEEMRFEVPRDEMNQAILDFTRRYAFDLIRLEGSMSVIRHTREQVRDIFVRWLEDRGSHQDLVAALKPLFGEERARRIAVTETTRLFSWGKLEAWRRGKGVTHKIWETERDEKVCTEICRPLDNTQIPLHEAFVNPLTGERIDAPPAHVDCRCGVMGVIA